MTHPSRKIFIVEDDELIVHSLIYSLEKLGYTVAGLVTSGEACLDALEQVVPDLVLMDIGLAGKLDGIETAAILHERYGYPVVFLTALTDKEVLRRARESDAFGYLVKPFTDVVLLTTIEMSVSRALLYRQLQESERKFRELTDSVDEMVIELGTSGRIRYLNPRGEKLLGLKKSNATGIDFLSLLEREDDRARLLEKLELPASLSLSPSEIRVRSNYGRVYFFDEQLKPIIEDGRTTGLRGMLIDVTRIKLRQTLQQAITELSELLRNDTITFDGFIFYIIKLIRNLTGVNSVYFNKYDMQTGATFTYEHAGHKEFERKAERQLTSYVVQNRQPLFLQGEQLETFLVEQRIPEAEIQARAWIGIPIQAGASFFGVLAVQSFDSEHFLSQEDFDIFRDCAHHVSFIFQSVAFKIKARQDEFRYQHLIESINEGIIQLDYPDNVIRFVNKRFLELLEIDPERVLPGSPLEKLYFLNHNFEFLQAVFAARKRGQSSKYELSITVPSGKVKWFLVSGAPVYNDTGRITGSMSLWLDITEKRENERRVRESSERLNEVVKNIKEAFWLIDWQTQKILYGSPSFEDIYGLAPGGLNQSGGFWFGIAHPEDQFIHELFVEKAPLGVYDVEFRIQTPAGKQKWVHERAFPIYGEKGEVVKIAGYSLDVSDRKTAQLELAQSESNKKAIINAIPDSLLIVSAEGIILDNYLEESVGLPAGKSSHRGRRFTRLFDRENARKLHGEFRKFTSGDADAQTNFTIRDITLGQWFELRFVHIDTKRKLILIRNVTASKKQELELKKFYNLVEQSEELIVITDKRGAIEYVNPRFSQLTGYQPEEVIGKFTRLLNSGKHPPEFFRDFWQTILNGNSFSGEFVNCKKNGELYVEEKIVTPLFNENGEIRNYISTGRDITEKRNTEQKLEAYRKLQEFLEKKQARIRTLSLLQGQEEERKRIARELHDGLGQSLSATRIYLEKIEAPDAPNDSDLSRVHRMVVETIHEVRRISNDLSPSGLHDFGLLAAVRNLTSKLGESFPKINFIIDSDIGRKRFKNNIEINVFRIVQEAINNVIKHSGADRIEINLLYGGEHLRVSIMDNGSGFDPAATKQGPAAAETGNGLANMRERARIIGGKLVIVAEKKSGVLISFQLKTVPTKK